MDRCETRNTTWHKAVYLNSDDGKAKAFGFGLKFVGQRTRYKICNRQNTPAIQRKSGLSVESCCVVREQDSC